VRDANVLARSILGALSFLAVTAMSDVAQATPAPEPPADDSAKIDAQVQDAVEDGGTTTFWVRLADRADLSAATAIADWAARGAYVVNQLEATANASQAPVRAELDAAGTKYTSFWVTNALRVRGNEAVVDKLAENPAVEAITAPVTYELPDPVRVASRSSVAAVEWGIARINAADVWSQFGVRGAGIVVANIDTGVQYDHPALVRQYRGTSAVAASTTTTTGGTRAGSAGPRRPRRVTTTATAPTRWGRWSATTGPGTRSASPLTPAGSPPRVARTATAPTLPCCRRASSSSPRPTWPG